MTYIPSQIAEICRIWIFFGQCQKRSQILGLRPAGKKSEPGASRLPRFYFQIIEDGVAGPVDEEGLEYSDLEAAESDTEAVIAQLVDDNALQEGRTIEVVISDEGRRPVSRIKLKASRDRIS